MTGNNARQRIYNVWHCGERQPSLAHAQMPRQIIRQPNCDDICGPCHAKVCQVN
jgi:hypothetical protein